MDVIRQIAGAATQAGIATERVRQMVRIFDRNRAASMATVDVLQRLATGNLSSAAELLTGATSALSVASDLFPQVGAVMRSFNATQASIGSILKAVDGSNFPLVRAAADSVKSALGGAWNQFNAAVGLKDSAVMDVIKSTGVGSMLSGLVDGASSSTPHLMTMTTDAGDAFHFNLSTAAHDKLRRATRYRVASQERLNRQEALQPVSEGGRDDHAVGCRVSVARCRHEADHPAACDRRPDEACTAHDGRRRSAWSLAVAGDRGGAGRAARGWLAAQANFFGGVRPLWRRL